MAGKLVTIARFDLTGQAHIAKNALEAAGIKSVLADEQTIAMDWLLSNAIGGIKVQVLEEDAERAVTALEESLGSDETVDEETMTAAAVAAEKEDIDAPLEPIAPPSDSPPTLAGTDTEESAAGKPSERDEYARRLFLTSVFSVLVPPLWFYAIYLFLNAAFGEGSISERGRTDLRRGSAIMGAGLIALFAILLGLGMIG